MSVYNEILLPAIVGLSTGCTRNRRRSAAEGVTDGGADGIEAVSAVARVTSHNAGPLRQVSVILPITTEWGKICESISSHSVWIDT